MSLVGILVERLKWMGLLYGHKGIRYALQCWGNKFVFGYIEIRLCVEGPVLFECYLTERKHLSYLGKEFSHHAVPLASLLVALAVLLVVHPLERVVELCEGGGGGERRIQLLTLLLPDIRSFSYSGFVLFP